MIEILRQGFGNALVAEQGKAKRALRTYLYGPGRMQPDAAIERYKERRVRDVQAPIGSTDYDELDASDSDAEESDDDTASFNPRRRRGPMSRFFSGDNLGGAGYTDAEMTAANAMIELAQSGAPATVPSGPSDASGYDSDASTVGFPTPPPGATVSPGSPLYDDDDRTPAEMGLVPFSPRYYETPDHQVERTTQML